MRYLVIPDIHGRRIWKRAVESKSWDKIIFLGDYVDSYTLRDQEITQNFYDIISFKKANYAEVTLLYGNHDLAYLFCDNTRYHCTGMRSSYLTQVHMMFKENLKLFRSCKQIDNFLFSHAGINKLWWDSEVNPVSEHFGIEQNSIPDQVHMLEQTSGAYILNDISFRRDKTSRKPYGGLYWADRKEWSSEDTMLPGITQIVGHSRVPEVIQGVTDKGTLLDIWFTDCNERKSEFLYIEDGEIKTFELT